MAKIKPVEFPIRYRKVDEIGYCKPWLTAGDQVKLASGQKFKRNSGESSGTSVEIDLGETVQRNQLYVVLMRTTKDGVPYYTSLRQLQEEEPAKKVEAMAKSIAEVLRKLDEEDEEDEEGGEGNDDVLEGAVSPREDSTALSTDH